MNESKTSFGEPKPRKAIAFRRVYLSCPYDDCGNPIDDSYYRPSEFKEMAGTIVTCESCERELEVPKVTRE